MRRTGDLRGPLERYANGVLVREEMMFALPIGAKLMVANSPVSGGTGEVAPIEGIAPLKAGQILLKIENMEMLGNKLIKCRDNSGHVRLVACEYLSHEAVEVMEAL